MSVYGKNEDEAAAEQEKNAPDDEGPLEEAEYPYGSIILKHDTGLWFQLPRYYSWSCSAAEVGLFLQNVKHCGPKLAGVYTALHIKI